MRGERREKSERGFGDAKVAKGGAYKLIFEQSTVVWWPADRGGSCARIDGVSARLK